MSDQTDAPAAAEPDAPPLAYRLLTGASDRAFCERISEALDEGYELYGSPSITFDGQQIVTAQAVVRRGTAVAR